MEAAMKSFRCFAGILFTGVVLLSTSLAQQASDKTQSTTVSASDPHAVLLASETQLALTGGTSVSDVTMAADSLWIAGGTKASGTASLKAKGTGQGLVQISAGAVNRKEIRNDINGPDGRWEGSDGAAHPVAPHNCWGPAAWFSPHAVVQMMSDPKMALRYFGQETRNGIAVDHIQMHRPSSAKNQQVAGDLEKLSTVEILLDSASHLPVAITFNTHPDDDYSRDIPNEVRFSDYRSVSGVMVPFHIQRWLQGMLNTDLTVTTATVNNGLTDSDFTLQ